MRRAAILVLMVMLVVLCGCKSEDYKNAVSLFENDYYDEAYQAFIALGEYKDSAEKAKECKKAIMDNFDLMVDSFLQKGIITFDELKAYVEENGDEVICDGIRDGYYDDVDVRKKHEDISYWYDPLTNERVRKGEVGVQQITEQHLFSGDLMVQIRTEVFYGTSTNAYGNSFGAGLYYKEKRVFGGYQEIQSFLSKAESSKTYAVKVVTKGWLGPAEMIRLVIVNDNELTITNKSQEVISIKK